MYYFENLKKPIQEKDALKKIGVYFLVNFVLILVGLVFIFPGFLIHPILGVMLACSIGLVLFVLGLVWNISYTYEYTQAGIHQRDTDIIWKKDKVELFKKSGKYLLVSIIYSIPLVFVSFFSQILSVLAEGAEDSNVEFILVMLFVCFSIFQTIFAFLYSFYVMQPALLQMIKTNTFKEAFNYKQYFKSSFKNRNYNLGVLFYFLITMFFWVVFFVNVLLTFVIIGVCLWPFTILAFMLFNSFAHPYAIGAVYGMKE
ncbi:MAG: hypothetical protein KatS3mg085_651 [Candidatus Dojkabacteria bacterium]|nr:MAG: hypothetical protein KatS3mg085_651 [Candidatus Dojkabacteria bacterium]